jgi:tRNA(His) 5'-end guanylyltransferase
LRFHFVVDADTLVLQADFHINNLYNSCFWELVSDSSIWIGRMCNPPMSSLQVKSGQSQQEAEKVLLHSPAIRRDYHADSPTARVAHEQTLSGTVASDKNELLFQRGINYAKLPRMFRKGSILLWKDLPVVCPPSFRCSAFC